MNGKCSYHTTITSLVKNLAIANKLPISSCDQMLPNYIISAILRNLQTSKQLFSAKVTGNESI